MVLGEIWAFLYILIVFFNLELTCMVNSFGVLVGIKRMMYPSLRLD